MERKLAIVSVTDKKGIVEFCQIISQSYKIISTGKTALHLQEAGIEVRSVKDLTGYPEILGGRVKTLHPMLLGGILGTEEFSEEMNERNIQPIGLVVVNLYEFHKIISKEHDLADAIENIDIGGVTLLRAAAKNFREVITISSPDEYKKMASLISKKGITEEIRKELAMKAFYHTAFYDSQISNYFKDLTNTEFPPKFIPFMKMHKNSAMVKIGIKMLNITLIRVKSRFSNSYMENEYHIITWLISTLQ